MYIKDKEQIYLIDRDNSVFSAPGICFPSRKKTGEHVKDTLADSVSHLYLLSQDGHVTDSPVMLL